jgi:peptidoglycan/LPS O-acetylase OafA/YrhL
MSQQAGPQQSRRLVSIDLLRGLAAFFVVMYHGQGFFRRSTETSLWSGGIYNLWIEPTQQVIAYLLFGLGFLGVPMFFVISGFCIHLPFAGGDRPLHAIPFAKRRLTRLYPAYLATCVAGFVLAIEKFGLGQGIATWSNFLGHLAFWHYDFPIQPGGVELTIVIWSIVIEVQFYAMYVILFTALARFGMGRAAALGLALDLIYRISWNYGGLGSEEYIELIGPHRFAITRFGEWLLGAWVAEAYVSGRLAALGGSAYLGWRGLAMGSITVLASLLGVALLSAGENASKLPVTIGFSWILASMLSLELSGKLTLGSRRKALAIWLGDRSYSLYLIHYIVIALTGEVAARWLDIPNKDVMGGTLLWFGVTIAAIVLALFSANIMYRLIEKPTHAMARRIGRI